MGTPSVGPSAGRTVDETSHRLVCDLLHGVLCRAAQAGPGAAEGIGSILHRVSAVVYTLLLDHPIDRRGRCRSCRHARAVIGFGRRPCRIHLRASYWLLRQPDKTMLLSHLADDLGLGIRRLAPASASQVPQGGPAGPHQDSGWPPVERPRAPSSWRPAGPQHPRTPILGRPSVAAHDASAAPDGNGVTSAEHLTEIGAEEEVGRWTDDPLMPSARRFPRDGLPKNADSRSPKPSPTN